jgi:hypothetical protein
MATENYVYYGNVRKGDGTTRFKFKSSEDDTVYEVPMGSVVALNAQDLERLNDRYLLIPEGEAPGVTPSIKTLQYLDEGTIPVGYILKRTSRGFEFELDTGGEGGGGGHVIQEGGSSRTQRTNLNFTGAGVDVSDDAANDATVIDIPGGGGGGGVPDDNSVTAAKIHTSLKGGAAAGTEALRALGTTATTAAAGNHSHAISGVTGLQAALDDRPPTIFTNPGDPAPDPGAYPEGTIWIEVV